MAKRAKTLTIQITFDPVEPTKRLDSVPYCCDDSVQTDLCKTASITGLPRALTGGELAGTLDAFLTAMKTAVETQESIV